MNPMRKWNRTGFMLIFFILVLAATACSSVQKEADSAETESNRATAPASFQLEGLNDRTIDSSKVNKPMFLSFWATWCSYCREEMPVLESLYLEYGGRIEFAAVNLTHLDSVKTVEDYAKEHNLSLPVYFDKDGEVTGLFRVISTPTVVLLDQQGKEVYRKVGAGGENSTKEFKQRLDDMLSDTSRREDNG